jgi:anti-anti-sigma factor
MMMNVKIDTKEKFTVITPKESDISANMTDQLVEKLLSYLDKEIPHIILNMKEVNSITEEAAEKIAGLQQRFYEKKCSFIVCELQNNAENSFKSKELLENMNITPTESEAWDILQMEEIEREIMGDFDNSIDG